MAKPQDNDLVLINRNRESYKTKVSELLSDITKMPGPVGPQGPRGVQGPIGADGDTGARGLLGPTGNTGIQGPSGNTGATGNTGPRGAAGSGMQVRDTTTGTTKEQVDEMHPDESNGGEGAITSDKNFGAGYFRGGDVLVVKNGNKPGESPVDNDGNSLNATPTVDKLVDGTMWLWQKDSNANYDFYGPGQWIIMGEIVSVEGSTGATGIQGLPSTVPGPEGPTGATGAGATGPKGATGSQGETGFRGPDGPTGATGAGIQGPSGPTGLSSYEVYQEEVNSGGTTEEYFEYITGATGPVGSVDNITIDGENGVSVDTNGGNFTVKGVEATSNSVGVIKDVPNGTGKNYVRNDGGWTPMTGSSSGVTSADKPLEVKGNDNERVFLNYGNGLHLVGSNLEPELGKGLYFDSHGRITAKEFEGGGGEDFTQIVEYFYPTFVRWTDERDWDQTGRGTVENGGRKYSNNKVDVKLPKGSNGCTVTTIWRIQVSPSHNKNYGGGVGVASVQGVCGYHVSGNEGMNFRVHGSYDDNLGSLSFNHTVAHAMSGGGEAKARDWKQDKWVVRMDRWDYSTLSGNETIQIQNFLDGSSSGLSHSNHIIWNAGARQTILPFKAS